MALGLARLLSVLNELNPSKQPTKTTHFTPYLEVSNASRCGGAIALHEIAPVP